MQKTPLTPHAKILQRAADQMGAVCKNCAHWCAGEGLLSPATCRAHPPTAFLIPDEQGLAKGLAVWPHTEPDHWCGEHTRAMQ